MALSSKSESACIIYLFLHKGSEDKGTLFSFVLQKSWNKSEFSNVKRTPCSVNLCIMFLYRTLLTLKTMSKMYIICVPLHAEKINYNNNL